MKPWEGGRITPSQQRKLIKILKKMIETVHTMIKTQHRSNQDEVETEVFLIRYEQEAMSWLNYLKLHDDREELWSLYTEISRRHDDRYYSRWGHVDEKLNDKRQKLLDLCLYTFAEYLGDLITDQDRVAWGSCGNVWGEEDANLDVNSEQRQAAEQNMMQWLTDRNEQGKAPSEIEYTEQFNYHEMFYYLFKFKTDPSENWMLGVSGGFKAGSLKPCGHTFSDMRPYCEETQVKDAIQMVDHVVECWKERNRRFDRR